jgi:hypothetical protein
MHMRDHSEGISAVILVGDVAYTDYGHRRWNIFLIFSMTFRSLIGFLFKSPLEIMVRNYSIVENVQLVAILESTGLPFSFSFPPADIDKAWSRNEIFQAYETRFRMTQVYPAELGTFDGTMGQRLLLYCVWTCQTHHCQYLLFHGT